MTTQELLEKTKELIEIPSTADNPRAMREAYDFMVNFVHERAKGKEVTIEEFEHNGVKSFLAYRGKKRPTGFHIILNGHIDVVPGKPSQFKAEVKDGKLYGRGVYDMKAACIILADLFCEFVGGVPYELGLQIVTDEETGGFDGAYYQVQQGVRSDFVICGEAGRKSVSHELANETKGGAFVDVEFFGRAAHAGYPWKGDNASVRAANFVKKVHDMFPTPDDEYHGTTVTVTAVLSETGVHNRIPEHALVRLDLRTVPNDKYFSDEHSIHKFVKDIDPTAQVTVRHIALPAFADPEGEFIQDLRQAAEAVENKPFNLVRRHGSGDGRHFAEVGGQACEFGIAGEDHHGDDEHVTIKAFENYYATMRQFLRNTRVPGQLPLEKPSAK